MNSVMRPGQPCYKLYDIPVLKGEAKGLEAGDVSGKFEDSEDPHDPEDLRYPHHLLLVTRCRVRAVTNRMELLNILVQPMLQLFFLKFSSGGWSLLRKFV